jgi:hypothetical protein
MYILDYSNSLINNHSTLITIFAETGLLGLILLLLIYINLGINFLKLKFQTAYFKNLKFIFKPFMFGLLIFVFVYGSLAIYSEVIITIWIFIALALKFEKLYPKII